MLTTLTKEFFLPRFLERDEGERESPLEDYPWEQCIADQTKAHSKEEAEKICGYIKSKYGN